MIYTHYVPGKTVKEVISPLDFQLQGMVYAFKVNNLLSHFIMHILLILIFLSSWIYAVEAIEIDKLIIPGERVGIYVINKSTLKEILIEDSPAKRKEFSDKGIYFQFEKGEQLTGVTVNNDKFQLESGIKVGSSLDRVKIKLGDKYNNQLSNGTGLIIYQGIIFMIKDNIVMAISVVQNGLTSR